MALFKRTAEYVPPAPPAAPAPVAEPPPPAPSPQPPPAATPLNVADLDEPAPATTGDPVAPAAPDAIPLDDLAAWEQLVVVDQSRFPSFYDVPKRNVHPFNSFYFAWTNQNALNLQIKYGIGWRIVPPALCRQLGLSDYQIKADRAQVMDMVLVYIPRRPIDEFYRRVAEAEAATPLDAPAVQQFLDMNSPKHGVTTFAGPAEEVAERQRWRVNRPVRVGWTGKGRK